MCHATIKILGWIIWGSCLWVHVEIVSLRSWLSVVWQIFPSIEVLVEVFPTVLSTVSKLAADLAPWNVFASIETSTSASSTSEFSSVMIRWLKLHLIRSKRKIRVYCIFKRHWKIQQFIMQINLGDHVFKVEIMQIGSDSWIKCRVNWSKSCE